MQAQPLDLRDSALLGKPDPDKPLHLLRWGAQMLTPLTQSLNTSSFTEPPTTTRHACVKAVALEKEAGTHSLWVFSTQSDSTYFMRTQTLCRLVCWALWGPPWAQLYFVEAQDFRGKGDKKHRRWDRFYFPRGLFMSSFYHLNFLKQKKRGKEEESE